MKKNPISALLSSGLLTLLLFQSVFAQQSFDKIREVPIATPQAASFNKFVEFPLNNYNGLPDISIPLYTFESGDISVPISLSYHAGGIKVAEEASWVGLGWSLSAGGVINRQINGRDDLAQNNNNYFDKIFPMQAHLYQEEHTNKAAYNVCLAVNAAGQAIITSYPGDLLTNVAAHGDGEPDTYIYNFVGNSGKFIEMGDVVTKTFDVSKNDVRFIFKLGIIIAQTSDGFRYEFSKIENSRVGQNPYVPTSHYLTKITSPTGKVVTFTYSSLTDVRQLTSFSEEYQASAREELGGAHGFDGPIKRTRSYTSSNPVYLSRITSDEGYVDFIPASREDMNGNRLDRIEVRYTNNTLLRKFTLNQTYFVSTANTPHYLQPNLPNAGTDSYPYPEDFLKKRLRLDGITETGNGTDPNEVPKTHTFEYYPTSLPYKSSFAVDYWGYYNGILNTTFIPKTKGIAGISLSTFASIKDYPGAIRDADVNFAKAATLKKVTYPSKGWTEYEHELHRYTNYTVAPKKYIYSPTPPVTDTGVGIKEGTFTLTEGKNVRLSISLYCNCASNTCLCNNGVMTGTWDCGRLMTSGYGPNVMYAELRKLNPSTGVYDFMGWDFNWDVDDILPCTAGGSSGDFTKDVFLTPGTYKMIANYPDDKTGSLGSKMAHIIANFETEYYEPNPGGGGLRVSRIKHYAPETNSTLTSTYTYENGLMMKFPMFYWRKPQYKLETSNPPEYPGPEWYYKYIDEFLYSNSISAPSISSNGNTVGYGKVTVTREDGSGGKTEYLYENLEDNFNENSVQGQMYNVHAFAPGVPSVPHLKNGFLKEMTVLDAQGNTVRKTTSIPLVAGADTFWSFKGMGQGLQGQEWSSDPCGSLTGYFFMYYFYPIQIGKVVPSQTTTIEVINGANVTSTTTYQYNAHGYRTSEQTTLHDGKIRSTEFKYLMDYDTTSGWLKELNRRNNRREALEIVNKVNALTTTGTFVKYQTINNNTVPFEVYEIETDVPKTVSTTTPGGIPPSDMKLKGTITYDSYGNIVSTQEKDNMFTSYIWGHGNKYVIAKVDNALSNQIYHTSFEEATANVSTTAKTGNKAYSGTAAFTVPLPSAGTYKLTYWKKTGTADWVFFETTMSAATAIGGGTNVLIDEVRVYPATALMTTYTHDLLIGLKSITDPRCYTTSYHYDSFGRLMYVKDHDGKITHHYKYHYKEQ
jgi:hypothetical protein